MMDVFMSEFFLYGARGLTDIYCARGILDYSNDFAETPNCGADAHTITTRYIEMLHLFVIHYARNSLIPSLWQFAGPQLELNPRISE